ncbi:MAG TPA: hypothetical protein VG387_04560 [Rhizomicrobium sp.]|jgi:hypothetical protein|nr:hypothetical protein [Rhizomicrobium sp.]
MTGATGYTWTRAQTVRAREKRRAMTEHAILDTILHALQTAPTRAAAPRDLPVSRGG